MSCCANCGTAEVDDVKLKICTACKAVRYCGVTCQKEHRPKHKRACKNRAAEMRDELLFKQPESTCFGDCPICFLPLPIKVDHLMRPCCGKSICMGCERFNKKFECPFCRHPVPESKEEAEELLMKRADANDPASLSHFGELRYEKGDFASAFQYFSKAARLGDVEAHAKLSRMYLKGEGVERDEKKELHHAEEAAIGGHPKARHLLAQKEWENGRHMRAMKHLIIAAKLGHEESIQALKETYAKTTGLLSKEDLTTALRGYQAAVDATKSEQREKVEAVRLRK